MGQEVSLRRICDEAFARYEMAPCRRDIGRECATMSRGYGHNYRSTAQVKKCCLRRRWTILLPNIQFPHRHFFFFIWRLIGYWRTLSWSVETYSFKTYSFSSKDWILYATINVTVVNLQLYYETLMQKKSSIMCDKYWILKTESILKHLNENVCWCTYIICLLRVVKVMNAVNDFRNSILFCTW